MGMEINRQRFCELCALNEEMKEMDFDTPLGEGVGVAKGYTSSFSVKPDEDTGKIVGWDVFFQHIDNVSGDMEKEINKYKKQKEDVIITYVIESEEGNTFKLRDNRDGKVYDVISVCKETDKAEF